MPLLAPLRHPGTTPYHPAVLLFFITIFIMLVVSCLFWQVAERVRTDARVSVLERTNLRYLTLADLPDQAPVQLATLDLSFISVLKAHPFSFL